MKKIFLLLSLLVVSMFLIGCSENLAGEAHRSSRTNADGLINALADKEQQRCYNAKLRDCPRANEENVYALLARSNVFALDLMMDSKQRNFKSFKKSVNSYLGIIQKVASGEGSSKDKLIAKAIIGQTYASADQADILIMADLIMANHLGITANEMAAVNKMPGSELLKGISKSGPDLGASTGGMGSLIPPGASQSFFDCVQEALGSKSGGSSQQAPGGGASDPLMPVGPDGDFSGGSEGGMSESGESFDFDVGFCEEIDQGMMPGFGTSVDGEGSDLDELDDLKTGDVVSYEHDYETNYDVDGDGVKEPCTATQKGEFEVVATKGEQGTVFDYTTVANLEWTFTDETGKKKEISKPPFNQGFSKQNLKKQMGPVKFKVKKGAGSSSFDPEGDSGNIFGCPAVNAVEACMEAAGSADICTGLESMGEQGQVAMILENFCNSATGAEVFNPFDQGVIINPGNMINQVFLVNFMGFTQAQLDDLNTK